MSFQAYLTFLIKELFTVETKTQKIKQANTDEAISNPWFGLVPFSLKILLHQHKQ